MFYFRENSNEGQKPTTLFHMESTSQPDLKRVNKYPDLEPLDTCYDVLCDPYSYQVCVVLSGFLNCKNCN